MRKYNLLSNKVFFFEINRHFFLNCYESLQVPVPDSKKRQFIFVYIQCKRIWQEVGIGYGELSYAYVSGNHANVLCNKANSTISSITSIF